MSDYDTRMNALLLADQHRRWNRQQREDALLSNADDSRASLESYECCDSVIRGAGVIPRNPARTTTPRRQPRTRVVGVAAPAPDADAIARLAAANVEPTVLCYNVNDPDNATVRTVSEIRGSRDSAKNRAPVSTPRTMVDTATIGPVHGHNFND